MKIVYCIPSTSGSGGMERVLSNKANYWADILNYEVVIITTEQQNRKSFFYFSPKITFYDLSINYKAIQGYSLLKRLYWELLYKRKHRNSLFRLLKNLRADIVVSMFSGEERFLYRVNDGSKKVLEIHFSKYFREQRNRKGIWRGIDKFKSYIDEYIVKQYAAFVVLTNEDKSYWGNLPNIYVIPNGYKKIDAVDVQQERKKQIVAVGRLVEQKGYDRLIAAWNLIALQLPDWKLQIYGEGELYDELLEMVERYKLLDSVEINAPVRDIHLVYQSSAVLVMPSRYEGFGMVLIEAMNYGLPVIAYSFPCGPKDIISDGIDGLLVPDGDIHLLAEKILFLAQNSTLRRQMGKSALVKAQSFSFDEIMRKWEKLFCSLCGVSL